MEKREEVAGAEGVEAGFGFKPGTGSAGNIGVDSGVGGKPRLESW